MIGPEVLVCVVDGCERPGQLKQVPLPGGLSMIVPFCPEHEDVWVLRTTRVLRDGKWWNADGSEELK